jgi:prepilin-type N-terminal cleavage/methylation domain-containing protein
MTTQQREQTPRNQGYTLTELLIGVVVGAVVLAGAARTLVSHINLSRNFYSSGQVQQDLNRLQRLLAAETAEACAFQVGAVDPASCFAACTTTGANQLHLYIPLTTNPNADPTAIGNRRIISYRLNGNQVLRTGPRILGSGELDSNAANNQTDALVLDGVNTFTPTVSADCTSVDLAVRLTVPGSAQTVPAAGQPDEVFTLRAGAKVFN